MRIAIASQNRRAVTGHAGRCRRFWVFDVRNGKVERRELLELDKSNTLHASAPGIPAPLQGLDVLVAASICDKLSSRLARHGLRAVSTNHSNPEDALHSLID